MNTVSLEDPRVRQLRAALGLWMRAGVIPVRDRPFVDSIIRQLQPEGYPTLDTREIESNQPMSDQSNPSLDLATVEIDLKIRSARGIEAELQGKIYNLTGPEATKTVHDMLGATNGYCAITGDPTPATDGQ